METPVIRETPVVRNISVVRETPVVRDIPVIRELEFGRTERPTKRSQVMKTNARNKLTNQTDEPKNRRTDGKETMRMRHSETRQMHPKIRSIREMMKMRHRGNKLMHPMMRRIREIMKMKHSGKKADAPNDEENKGDNEDETQWEKSGCAQ